MSANRINGKSSDAPSKRKPLTKEEVLAFKLYAEREAVRTLLAENARLQEVNGTLAADCGKLAAMVSVQSDANVRQNMLEMETEYEFLKTRNVMSHDTETGEFFLAPPPTT